MQTSIQTGPFRMKRNGIIYHDFERFVEYMAVANNNSRNLCRDHQNEVAIVMLYTCKYPTPDMSGSVEGSRLDLM